MGKPSQHTTCDVGNNRESKSENTKAFTKKGKQNMSSKYCISF